MSHPNEPWSTTAPTYSSNVGRTSILSASRLLEHVNQLSPISRESTVLDNGAGTGAVTCAVASRFPGTRIRATDTSASMLTSIDAQQLLNVKTQVLDARYLCQAFESGTFSHVFSTFMLQTITTPLAAVQEMHAVLAPGGVVGIGIWAQRNGPFEIWEQACKSIDPTYNLPPPFDDPKAWRTREELEDALNKVGFSNVSSEDVTMPFSFESTEAFMQFWFGAKNPASVKVMSNWKGDMDEAKKAVARVVREEYRNGKDVKTWAVLGVGRKLYTKELHQ